MSKTDVSTETLNVLILLLFKFHIKEFLKVAVVPEIII